MLGKNCMICYYFIPTINPSKYALSRSGLSVGVEKEGIKEKPLLKHTYTKQDTYDCERKKGSGLSCAQAPYSFSLTYFCSCSRCLTILQSDAILMVSKSVSGMLYKNKNKRGNEIGRGERKMQTSKQSKKM